MNMARSVLLHSRGDSGYWPCGNTSRPVNKSSTTELFTDCVRGSYAVLPLAARHGVEQVTIEKSSSLMLVRMRCRVLLVVMLNDSSTGFAAGVGLSWLIILCENVPV